MESELAQFSEQVRGAQCPEDVFGIFEGSAAQKLEQASVAYRSLAKIAHPDRYKHNGDQATAQQAFQSLQEWWQEAQARIADGTYGTRVKRDKIEPVIIHSGKHQYTVTSRIARGDFCNLYRCTAHSDDKPLVFNAARDPRDNDLIVNEADVLRRIRSDRRHEELLAYIPKVYESFRYKDNAGVTQRAIVLNELEGFYTLRQVREAYPGGIDPRDMAWMCRRLLVALGLAHANGVIHGAVLPEHLLIHPELHGLVLIDWTCAVTPDDPSGPAPFIPAMSLEYEPWYPPEVKHKESPGAGTDIYMAVQCMIYLLGGEPAKGLIPGGTPKLIRRFLTGCLYSNPRARPQDAWGLLNEFDELIERMWGKRTFHPFAMPKL